MLVGRQLAGDVRITRADPVQCGSSPVQRHWGLLAQIGPRPQRWVRLSDSVLLLCEVYVL